MLTLFDAFRTASNSLKAAGEALAVTQMNLTNAGVAGYARQNVNLIADGFDPTRGLAGGVRSGTPINTRSKYAEQVVWGQASRKGFFEGFTQAANGVDFILGLNDVNGGSGVQSAMDQLFKGFSELQGGAHSPLAQSSMLQKANGLAITISQTAEFLEQSSASAATGIQATVDKINTLIDSLQQWSSQPGSKDGAAEAQLYSNLEQLSELVPITAQVGSDGSLTVMLNGQIPLVNATQKYPLSVAYAAPDSGDPFPTAEAQLQIHTASGEDITGDIDGGELGGLLDYRNRFLASLLGDGKQQGDLNRLAQGIADSVNSALGGTPLFQYDAADPTHIARGLKVDTSFTVADLGAAINADPTIPDKLATIFKGTVPANQVDGQSFTAFLVTLSVRSSTELNSATHGLNLQAQFLTQAQNMRESVQGSSTEQAAVELLQYQRAYEAATRVISTLDQLTELTINLGR